MYKLYYPSRSDFRNALTTTNSKSTEMISRALKTVSPVSSVQILSICHQKTTRASLKTQLASTGAFWKQWKAVQRCFRMWGCSLIMSWGASPMFAYSLQQDCSKDQCWQVQANIKVFRFKILGSNKDLTIWVRFKCLVKPFTSCTELKPACLFLANACLKWGVSCKSRHPTYQ